MSLSLRQKAKELYRSEQYSECKQILLQLIEVSGEGASNNKFICRLGDVCVELEQYEEAKSFYKECIDDDPSNPAVHSKIAVLLSEHFNEYEAATKHFEKCIALNPENNDFCWFNFGKHWFKQNKFEKAIECYEKCQRERACVNYQFAKALISSPAVNIINLQSAKKKLDRAIELKPDVQKYRDEHNVCSQKLDALQRKMQIFNDERKDSEQENSLCSSHSEEEKSNLSESKAADIVHDESIKYLLYSFEQNLAYWNLHNIQLSELEKMQTIDIIVEIFGGTDRMDRLRQHFNQVLSSPNGIRLGLISVHNIDMVIYALKRVDLWRYFADGDVFGEVSDVQQCIYGLSERYNLNIAENVLFIDSDLQNIDFLSNVCKVYGVWSEYALNGLSLKHMNQIEVICAVAQLFDFEPIPNETKLLRLINKTIYGAIKKEVSNMQPSDNMNSLPVIEWIHQNWKDPVCKAKFLFFAEKYREIRECKNKKSFWRIANIMPQMLKLDDSNELIGRYAVSLSKLHHHKLAEEHFMESIKGDSVGLNCHNFAYFLFNQARYEEAEKYFIKAMRVMDERFHYQSCLGYARTLEALERWQEADDYYKQAIKDTYDMGKMQYHYGMFLYHQQRYNDAKKQFAIALKYHPNVSSNHYWMEQTVQKLESFKYTNTRNRSSQNEEEREKYERHNRALAAIHKLQSTHMSQHRSSVNIDDEEKEKYERRNRALAAMNRLRRNNYPSPLHKYTDPIDSAQMELLRENMQLIAHNIDSFSLSEFRPIYREYFQCDIKAVYGGKVKNVIMYFQDLFELKWNKSNNFTFVISKKCVKSGDPINSEFSKKRVSPINVAFGYDSIDMNKYQNEMKTIAEKTLSFNLSQFPLIYRELFGRKISCIYHGKVKNLIIFYNSYFKIRYDTANCRAISKIYKEQSNLFETPDTKYAVEFDRFWFDDIGIVTETFNHYYDEFLQNHLNDIRLLFEDGIEKKLKKVIKVESFEDYQCIMGNIENLRKENKEFLRHLDTYNLTKYYPLFTSKAIFTTKGLKFHIKTKQSLKEIIFKTTSTQTQDTNNSETLVSSLWNMLTIC